MAAAVRCLLAAFLLGNATAIHIEQPTRRPYGGVRQHRKDIFEKRQLAMVQTHREAAAAYLEKQAIKLDAAEMAVLAARAAQAGTDNEAEYRELRAVIQKVIAGGAGSVIARLQDFCAGEVKKTGKNLTHVLGLKNKAEAELVQLATKADTMNKRLAGLKPGLKKTKRELSALRKAAKKGARPKKVHAKEKHGQVSIPKKLSLANMAKLTAANNAAAKDFLQQLDDQMEEAKDAKAWQKVMRLKFDLKDQRGRYNVQEKSLKLLKSQLVTKAQAAQVLEGTVQSLQQYGQKLQSKCGKGKEGQGKEEFEAIQAAYRILSGEHA